MTSRSNPLEIPGWTHIYSGKVRDLYVPNEERFDATGLTVSDDAELRAGSVMVVASDRISAFDRILPTEIPDKGKILTQMSLWWFEQLKQVPNHVLSTDVPDVVAGRAMICRSLNMFPVECIVRGYLTGSGLAVYNETGEIAGVKLPAGLVDGSRLDTPIFTPTGKAEVGEHDELVTREELYAEVGQPAPTCSLKRVEAPPRPTRMRPPPNESTLRFYAPPADTPQSTRTSARDRRCLSHEPPK